MPEKKRVTFQCSCALCLVSLRVTEVSFACAGEVTKLLPPGEHTLYYRAQGTPGTQLTIKVTAGGTMNPVERELPPDGLAAGTRKLTVVHREERGE